MQIASQCGFLKSVKSNLFSSDFFCHFVNGFAVADLTFLVLLVLRSIQQKFSVTKNWTQSLRQKLNLDSFDFSFLEFIPAY